MLNKRWQQVGATLAVLCLGVGGWLCIPPQWQGPQAEPIPAATTARHCHITRDKHDVPHINAPHLESAFYCWGLVHAQDRGWQMDYLRRLGRGRVAEYYGGMKNVRRDFFMRLLGFREIASRWRAHMMRHSPRKYELFQYYVWGINAGFQKLRKTHPNHPVYRKYGFRLAPWRISDSMIILLLQSFSMTSMAFTNDLKHARLRRHLGTKRYHQLYGPDKGMGPLDHAILRKGEHFHVPPPPHGKRTPTPTQHRYASTATTKTKRALLTVLEQMVRALPALGPDTPGAVGSNSWVVGPKLSRNGYPLLANDTHMSITTPNFWHEAHLTTQDQTLKIDVSGFAVPGLPAIVLGHNKHVAWGMTAGQSNTADVMLVEPNKRGFFKMGKRTHQLHKIRPIVWLRKGPFHIPIFWETFARSRIGPILPIPTGDPYKHFLMRWVTYHVKAPPLAMIGLMYAKTAKDVDRQLQQMTLPNLSAVFADNKGNIGFRQFGLVAKRREGIHGLLDAQKPKQRWQGFLTPDDMPHVFNPPRQYVVTANNRPFPDNYPYFLGHAFAPGFRANRISTMLEVSKRHTVETMRWIQTDTRVPMADKILALLLEKLTTKREMLTSREKEAIARLRKWDRKATKNSVGATLFRAWVEALRVRLFSFDRVKQPSGKGYHYPGALGLIRAIHGRIPVYTSAPLENELRASLGRALSTLEKNLGKQMDKWQWGRIHRIHFSSLMGKDAPFHPPPQAKDGDYSTVNVGYHTRTIPYRNQYAASVRMIVELGPKIRSFAALAGAQIDDDPTHLSAEHKRWLNNKYRKRLFTPREIKRHQKSTQTVTY